MNSLLWKQVFGVVEIQWLIAVMKLGVPSALNSRSESRLENERVGLEFIYMSAVSFIKLVVSLISSTFLLR